MPGPVAVKDVGDDPAVRVKALYNIMTSIEVRVWSSRACHPLPAGPLHLGCTAHGGPLRGPNPAQHTQRSARKLLAAPAARHTAARAPPPPARPPPPPGPRRLLQNRLGGGEGVEGLYGSVNRSGMHKVLECFRARCGLDAGSRLVDIGAGLGRPLLHALIEPGIASAFGVEIDRVKVDKADAFLRQTLAEMRRRGLATDALAAPRIQCSPVEQVGGLMVVVAVVVVAAGWGSPLHLQVWSYPLLLFGSPFGWVGAESSVPPPPAALSEAEAAPALPSRSFFPPRSAPWTPAPTPTPSGRACPSTRGRRLAPSLPRRARCAPWRWCSALCAASRRRR